MSLIDAGLNRSRTVIATLVLLLVAGGLLILIRHTK